MLHPAPVVVLRRVLRFLPVLFLCALIACAGGDDSTGGDTLPGDVLSDLGHGDMVIDTPPGDMIPEIGPDLPSDVQPPDVPEDLEPEFQGDVIPEIVPDTGPCAEGCDDGDPCTLDECDPEIGCVYSVIEDCCPGQFPFELGFEGDDPLVGGTVEDLINSYPDAPELTPLTWQVVDDFAKSGAASLYFGDPGMDNYHNDHRVASRFISAPFTLEAGYAHTLALQAWIDVEEGIWSDYLVIFVQAGDEDYPVWAKDDFNVSMGAWNLITVDLTPFAGESISLAFLFDTHDEKENFGGGVYLDDVTVERACEPSTCAGLSDCFTPSPCLDGDCVEGECVYTWDAECCLTPAECEDWDGCTLEFCGDNACYSQPDPDPACCNTSDECADEDEICTVDVCKNNLCTYLPTGTEGCCQVDVECDDTDPCTKDLCSEQACVYINLCCAADEDCDDGDDQCTADQCIDGACYFVSTGADGCCVEELVDETFEDEATPDFTLESTLVGVGFEVEVGDAYGGAKAMILEAVEPSGSFTATATLAVTEIPPVGATLSFAVKLSMGTSGDCDQNEFRVKVGNEVVWSGCATLNNYLPVALDLSAYAGDPGPVAFVYEVNPSPGATYWAGIDTVVFSQSCCSADEDCDDGNACTANVCPGSNAVCQFPPIDGCCLTSTECDDGGICTQDVCTDANVCEHYNLCCESDTECDDGDDVCTDDLCINDFCQYIPTGASGCCTPLTWQDDFEAGLAGWEIAGSTGDFGWHANQTKAVSGSFSLAYSNASGTDYNNNAFGTALSPPVDLPDQSGVSLVFQLWYQIENSFDELNLYVITDAGDVHLEGWTGTGGTAWQEVSIDLTEWAGQAVQFRFEFDSDSSLTYAGVFIDDLSITQECCSDDAECDDGNPCTVDSCPGTNSLCLFEPIPGCCSTFAECDDGDPCTADSCPMNGEGCQNIDICCQSDADCDDGDDVCTDDLCINDFCQYIPTGASGCCTPLTWQDDFEAGLAGWEITGSTGDFGWHANQTKAVSGSFSLAYSNASGTDYNNNAFGTALSPPVDLPDQSGVSLVFQLWYQIENSFDELNLYVITDAGDVHLEDWAGTGGTAWQEVSIDLTEWAGQAVQFRFEFDSDSSFTYAGVFIDDLSITQECCSDDAECDDGNPCTVDSCPGIDSLCAFIPIEGCCLTNEECGDGDPCTQDTCTSSQGGECLNIWVCCDTDADCDDGEDVCTDDVCVDNYCQFLFTGASGCCIPVMYENDFEGNLDGWTINNSSDTYGWKLSTAKSVSGSQSLAYTDAGGTSYGSSNNGSCLSPTVELPDQPGLTLSFMLWYKIESCCDNFDLSVVHDGGTTLMANYASTIVTGWQEVTFDATAYQGQTVQLLLEFSCDGSVSYEGVFIDDLMVIQEDCCSEDVDCDDGAICTMDSCPWINSLCLFEPIPGCCSTFAECDDGDPCTEDSCPMNGEGCQNIDICCQSDADCDDGDDVCTNDTCVDEYCQFLFTGAPGCCQPLLWEDAFENGKGGWVFQNSSASPSWHLSTVKSSDGGTALAFSDAAGFSTGNDQDSTATSPTIEVGAQPGIALTFQVWYDTESGFDWCKVWVDHDGGSAQLDQFTGHNEIFWQEKTYSLEEWAGQAVNIRFEWHCDVSASYPGIWIDEMTITQGCCNTDVDCEDDNPCTVDDCPGLESMCSNTWMALCCLEDGDCNDMDECTVDLCVEMVCEYEPTGADGC